ncbi:hypothetical protein [Uliginosibacterium sediminicola]|uniref:Uncharacterized protein n=1 Tax=Uliginosibacterium sediminicola TaxID=2024550 RepID=A0ABU9Z0X7_9RHOO
MNGPHSLEPADEQSSALMAATGRLRALRSKTPPLTPGRRAAQAVLLALFISLMLLLALPSISQLQAQLSTQLLRALSIELSLVEDELLLRQLPLAMRFGLDISVAAADWFVLSLHAVIITGVFCFALAMRSTPARLVVQALCVTHGISLALIKLQADHYSWDVLRHTQSLVDFSLLWLLLTPSLLAAGYYLSERRLFNRLLATLLIIAYQILSLPLKLVLHCLLISQLSTAVIPLLFLACGPLLDVLMFGALYTWVLSWPALLHRSRRPARPA